MKRILLCAVIVLWGTCFGLKGYVFGAEKSRRIAVYGSSVAYGTGDVVVETSGRFSAERVGDIGPDGRRKVHFKMLDIGGEGDMVVGGDTKELADILKSDGLSFSVRRGYQGRLREALSSRGWTVLNCSRGGDRTDKVVQRYESELLPLKPDYVFVGLSLANEGLKNARNDTLTEKQAVCAKYISGLRTIVDRIRKDGMSPVVGLNYPHGVYAAADYELLKKTNIEINGWDVPSANFLGAIDDGDGHWVPGYHIDNGHPNAGGHLEMFYAIVPTVFEALEAGKKTPKRIFPGNIKERSLKKNEPLIFKSEFAIHSHALVFWVCCAGDGVLAMIGEESAAGTKSSTLKIEKDNLCYIDSRGDKIDTHSNLGDGRWHSVAVSHGWAAQKTEIYVDSKRVGRTSERLGPSMFVLGGDLCGGQGAAQAEYRDWLVYRSRLNADEVEVLDHGGMIQASLELYVPLGGGGDDGLASIDNQAQSMSMIKYYNQP